MKNKYKMRISFLGILEYIWALILVLDGNSVYHALANKSFHFSLVFAFLSCVLCLYSKNVFKKDLFSMIILWVYSLVYLLFCRTGILYEEFLTMFIGTLPPLYVVFKSKMRENKQNELLYKVEIVVVILSSAAFVIWLLSLFRFINPNMFVTINWGHIKSVNGFFGLLFQIQRDDTFGIPYYRNTGFFCEGPMMSLWLVLSLMIECFLKEKSNNKVIVWLMIVICTTFASSGIICGAACIIAKICVSIIDDRKMSKKIVVFLLLMPFILLLGLYFAMFIVNLKKNTISFAMRYQDYLAGIIVWKHYPIFGSGFGNLASLSPYVYSANNDLINDFGYSNSIMAVMATSGVWGMLLYYTPVIVYLTNSLKMKKWRNVAFSLIYVMLFILIIFFARQISVVMLAYMLAHISTNKKVRKL